MFGMLTSCYIILRRPFGEPPDLQLETRLTIQLSIRHAITHVWTTISSLFSGSGEAELALSYSIFVSSAGKKSSMPLIG